MHFRGYAKNLSCSLALRVQLYYYPFSREDKTGAERSGYMHVVIKQTPYEVLVKKKLYFWLFFQIPRTHKPLGHSCKQGFLQYTILHSSIAFGKDGFHFKSFDGLHPMLFPSIHVAPT